MRFLIVDDDRACCELLRATLSPYATCDLALDGNEAIEAVRLALEDGAPYDLICLDIMMPKTDGHEALEAIRALEKRFGIYGSDGATVIMTTALHDSKHCIRSFREGCEYYYTKPIAPDELLARIRTLLGGLPERPRPETRPAVPNPSETREPVQQSKLGRYLIVDDDGLARELLRNILSPLGRCTFAYDGQEAIDAVRLAIEDNDPYDLICLDIMMPGVDGHDALRAIRKLETEHGIYGSDGAKVIMVTALRDSKHCIRSFREGCESYITKPINETELLKKIEQLGLPQTSGN